MSVKIKGLDEFEKEMSDLTDKAESLHGTHKVTITDEFIQSHSKFNSMHELLSTGGFSSIEEADEAKLDDFLLNNTEFKSWSDFQEVLAQDYFKQQLGL